MSKNEDNGGNMVYLLSMAMAIATGFMAGRTKKEENYYRSEQLPKKKKDTYIRNDIDVEVDSKKEIVVKQDIEEEKICIDKVETIQKEVIEEISGVEVKAQSMDILENCTDNQEDIQLPEEEILIEEIVEDNEIFIEENIRVEDIFDKEIQSVNKELSKSAIELLNTEILTSIDEKITDLLEVMKSHELNNHQVVKNSEEKPKSVVELLNTSLLSTTKEKSVFVKEENHGLSYHLQPNDLKQEPDIEVFVDKEIEEDSEVDIEFEDHLEVAMQRNSLFVEKQEEILDEISTEAINEIIQAIEINKGNVPIEKETEIEVEENIQIDVDIKVNGELSKEVVNRFISKVIKPQPQLLLERVRHIVICDSDEFDKFEVDGKNNGFANSNDMCIYCSVFASREEMTHNLAHIFDYYDGYHCYSNSRMFLRLFDECKGIFDLMSKNLESTEMKNINFDLIENSQEFFAECSQLYFNDSFSLAKECLKVYRYLHTTYTQIGE